MILLLLCLQIEDSKGGKRAIESFAFPPLTARGSPWVGYFSSHGFHQCSWKGDLTLGRSQELLKEM